jgi:hypothetical protein
MALRMDRVESSLLILMKKGGNATMGNTAMKKMMKGMKRVFSNSRGGAMLAVLIVVPVIAAMGLAMHYAAGNQAGATMSKAADSEAMYAAEGAAEKFLADITSNSAKMADFINAKEGDYVSAPVELKDMGSSHYRYPFKIMYAITKVANSGANPLTNTLTFKAEAQVFNNASPSWGTAYSARADVYQEIDRGAGVLKGCAANYDIWAGDKVEEKALFSVDFFKNGAYYAGNQYDACGGFSFSFGSGQCVDVSKNSTASPRAQASLLPFFCSNQCAKRGFTCDAPPLTFGGAIGSYGPDTSPNTSDDVNWLNVCGDTSHCGYTTGGYTASDLPYDQSYEYWMKKMVNCPGDQDISSCNLAKTTRIGKLYYPDTNKDLIPDAPYFFYDGDYTGLFPLSMKAFRSKTVYLYVKGDILNLKMGSMDTFNTGRLVVIAKRDVTGLSMMSSSILTTGVEVIAGRNYPSGTMMEISGFSNGTILANYDITIDSMMNIGMSNRLHLVAGHDVIKKSLMGGSLFGIGSNGKCGADCTAIDIETSVGRGRRYI